MKNKIVIFTDGGARGNPGPAGIGIVITGLSAGKQAFGEFIGKTTNNEAEYRALITALQKVVELSSGDDLEKIDCYADSELMVKQLKGEYKVKDSNLRNLFMEVLKLKSALKVPVSFHHVKRAKNAEADAIYNEVLDAVVGAK
ncbi:MAG: ribonuclease HI family protein [Candidatus Pacebacteria bacterium]|nr:ribonuclease HI family protein [Candidatus Paceibacterota bacterium]